MHSMMAAARFVLLEYHHHTNETTVLINRNDPNRVSTSFLVTLLLPILTLVYLELSRATVPTPIAVKKYPEVHYAGYNGDEIAIVKTVQVAHAPSTCTKKLIWVASGPHLGSRPKLSDISKLKIMFPATNTTPPLTRAVRRTSMSPVRASFDPPLPPPTDAQLHEECLRKLVEETLTYVQSNQPRTEALHRLIPKLEQFSEWNSVRAINGQTSTALIEAPF
ncbi:hypothetical protein K450DRAFT_242413 [Umbelopsis ramanniana AG]|uniref:Uncharacterized protein n=1 Tax=Umbelopsis ramanniana AG TaxID=1314678 RepID=A0AAD5EAD1_UMBRA|nr:uncharacterized protein K450DRAFT_242413 [Umbelopsis ramanniana AG]KAI8579260.1 hypothetical protein K450DRAFT_242413 [Umbelopsis ramanniana AG]